MDKKLVDLIYGALLHDVGKLVQHANFEYSKENHQSAGIKYIEEIYSKDTAKRMQINFDDISDQIRFHRNSSLDGLALNHNAYITYIADGIANATDRRIFSPESEFEQGAVTVIESLFNVFSNDLSNPKLFHSGENLWLSNSVNMPQTGSTCEPESYSAIAGNNNSDTSLYYYLEKTPLDEPHINSVLSILESALTYVPSSTTNKHMAGISLYNHSKTTAAFASAIYYQQLEKNVDDLKSALFDNAEEFYKEKAFLLASFDISGIQNFIYTITGKGAAKSLRSRSFYLEILCENLADNLLGELGLSRANLLYSGGGHAYFLLPNTKTTVKSLKDFEARSNQWLLDTFDTKLYVAFGWVEFASDILMMTETSNNDYIYEHAEDYKQLYRSISEMITANKMQRYQVEQIRKLNNDSNDGVYECETCKKKIREGKICDTCSDLLGASSKIRDGKYAFITSDSNGLPVFDGQYLNFFNEAAEAPKNYIRVYGINNLASDFDFGQRIFVGNYSESSIDKYATESEGIKRVAVLRMDIDNLGSGFQNGFSKLEDGKYNTFSRVSGFSYALSHFFKSHINYILANPSDSSIFPKGEDDAGARNLQIIYSGGDDVFIVGSWTDVIEAAIDIREDLYKFTNGKLTLSAGVGIFNNKYPIRAMAAETGVLEDAAKAVSGKDAICLFDKQYAFKWSEFLKTCDAGIADKPKSILDKYEFIDSFFTSNGADKGKSFAYKLLQLMRNSRNGDDDGISLARWVYLLTRSAPKDKNHIDEFSKFTRQLHEWFTDGEKSLLELELAFTLYAYKTRS